MLTAADKYYNQFSSAPIKNKKALQNHELYKLYQRPKRDKGSQEAHYNISEPNAIYQADLLYLPDDNGFKYCLVIVDPNTGITDAEPLKEHSSEAVLQGLKTIFDRKILPPPADEIQCDSGSEFKGAVKKYFNDRGIGVRYAKTGRSRQTPFAEARNKAIGKAVHQRQTAQQLLTNEISREWVSEIPKYVQAINDFVKTKPKKKPSYDPVITEQNNVLLPIGAKVRVQLDKPIESTGQRLSGHFRAGDIRWDPDIEKVTNIIISPTEPPLFQVSGNNNLGVAYTYNQLSRVYDDEKEPPSSVIRGEPTQYIVKNILDKKKVGRKITYKVQWKGYNATTETTWEAKSIFKTKRLKEMIKDYDDAHP